MKKTAKNIYHGVTLFLLLPLFLLASCGGEEEQAANKVTITFNTDGGSELKPLKIKAGDPLPASYLAGGSDIPAKTDYKFEGWLQGATPVTAETTFAQDAALKAKWLIKNITVSFNLNDDGDGTTPASIPSVTVENGTALGDQYPANPSRNWTWPGAFTFMYWTNGGQQYGRDTPITSASKTFRLIAEWDDNRIFTNSPAIHPGNHFQETGGTTRAVKTGEQFKVDGLFANVEPGAGVLSSKWYRTTSEAVANAATETSTTADVILEQSADPPGHEISLPFTRSEPAAGVYWYWVVVTNTNDNATELPKTKSTITQNKLKVTVTN